jgi:hypothetical protein
VKATTLAVKTGTDKLPPHGRIAHAEPGFAPTTKGTHMSEYDSLINRDWSDLPEEVLLPSGQYELAGRNVFWFPDKNAPEGSQSQGRVAFFVTPTAVVEVPDELLDQLPEGYDLTTNELSYNVFVRKVTDWSKEVLPALRAFGVDTPASPIFTEDGKLNPEISKQVRGQKVIGQIEQRTWKDEKGEHTQNNVSRIAPIVE